MERTVQFGAEKIVYELERKRVKNLNLRIRRDGSVAVSAPSRIPVREIDAWVLQKRNFIQAAQQRLRTLETKRVQMRQLVDGERIRILDRDWQLRVLQHEKEGVFPRGEFLCLQVKNPDDLERKQKLLTAYLREQCERVFQEILIQWHPTVAMCGVPLPVLRIRKMKTRWGSCIPGKGVITLNSQLLHTPQACVEYVALHELCHLIHPNHSREFYTFLAARMPDWKERRRILNEYPAE